MMIALTLFMIVIGAVAGAEGVRAGCRRMLTAPRPAPAAERPAVRGRPA
jgi:hypothetical protein